MCMNRFQERKDHMNEQKQSVSETKSLLQSAMHPVSFPVYRVKNRAGGEEAFSRELILRSIEWAQAGYEDEVDTQSLINETVQNCFDGITQSEISDAMMLAAVAFIERDP